MTATQSTSVKIHATQVAPEGATIPSETIIEEALKHIGVKVSQKGEKIIAETTSDLLPKAHLKVTYNKDTQAISIIPNSTLREECTQFSDIDPLFRKCMRHIDQFSRESKQPKSKKAKLLQKKEHNKKEESLKKKPEGSERKESYMRVKKEHVVSNTR